MPRMPWVSPVVNDPYSPEGRAQKSKSLESDLKISRHDPDPVILLSATLRWPIAARLAIAFSSVGSCVDVICPRQHPATTTRAVRRAYPCSVLNPLRSLRAAIESSMPDIIIPCDDNAAVQLHQLYVSSIGTDAKTVALRALIADSLGTPAACVVATSRGRLMELAAEEGVRVPGTVVVASLAELDSWLRKHKLPTVIKVDSTWGGQGVAIVRGHAEARAVFKRMSRRPSLVNATTRMLLDRDTSGFLRALKNARRTITLQDFVTGVPANRAVACSQGRELAGISVEAIRTQHSTGPATVVRVIDNQEMSDAVNRLARRLAISGMWGFDFVLEASTGAAYLIEINPRATPICHLALSRERNLPAAIYMQLTGALPHNAPATIQHDVIAMFPGELRRNPASSFLQLAFHDVPWGESGLIQDCLDLPWSERGVIARWWARMRPKLLVYPTENRDPDADQIGM